MDLAKVRSYYNTDFRLGIVGLAAVETQQYDGQLNEESLFLFCGRRADQIKPLYWTGGGYIHLYKRLSNDRFQRPKSETELRLLALKDFAGSWKSSNQSRKQPSANGSQKVCSGKNILKTAYFSVLYPGFMV